MREFKSRNIERTIKRRIYEETHFIPQSSALKPPIYLFSLSLYQVSLWWLKYWRNNECLPGCIQKQEGLRDNGAKLWELRVSQANESSSSTDHSSHETMDKKEENFPQLSASFKVFLSSVVWKNFHSHFNVKIFSSSCSVWGHTLVFKNFHGLIFWEDHSLSLSPWRRRWRLSGNILC